MRKQKNNIEKEDILRKQNNFAILLIRKSLFLLFKSINKEYWKICKCSVTIDVKQKIQKKSDSSSIIELMK